MKIKTFTILAFLLAFHSITAQSIFDKWQAVKEFNEVLSQTYPPAKGGDLEPVKIRSEEMMIKAEALLKLDIPAEYRTKSILAFAEKLQLKSKMLHKLVLAKAPDAEILKSVTELNNTFQDIVGIPPAEKK
ncbi:hypothetical protein [Flavobacterium psychrotolerans]|uniref:Uncharacterized protein n=1 Tax=Flavobacterium psychrotolerans TaxID=2169410 RepID=A0A2U1JHQ7_9FLAO|nr:hypothetical protein [Flavobacterium psychrotolerans]PWA04657.1 hypothetical protein DB895_10375 [Flavobacterium psychrotolerans]